MRVSEADIPTVTFAPIGPVLHELCQAAINRIDRQWPINRTSSGAAQSVIEPLLRAAYNTFRTVLLLCTDRPSHPVLPEFALSAGPLNRTLLDTLFTLLFLFDNLEDRSHAFVRAGWRENREELARYEQLYGEDAAWVEWIGAFREHSLQAMPLYRIKEEERDNLRLIDKWPLPGAMKSDNSLPADLRSFLTYLYDWYYKALSAQAHLSLPGLIMRSAALLPQHGEDEIERRARLDKQRSDNALVATVLMLSLVTEIEIEFQFGDAGRIMFVWAYLNEHFKLSEELWLRRAKDKLQELIDRR
jgi:hypothetical protein